MADDKKSKIREIVRRLRAEYPDVYVELNFTTPLELLIASILAAQNTDKNVNKVTETLFRKYRSPQDYLNVPGEELEQDIHSTGTFRQKTRAIRAMCEYIIANHKGELPSTMAELIKLPGVGRKTANVVLGYAFGKSEGIVVDTHNLRINAKLELSQQKMADKMERELLDLVEQNDWTDYGQLITWHGRRVCHAKKPNCANCVINDLCPSSNL